MPVRTIGLMVAITISFLAKTASAQDTAKVGITMGYPASIGVIWQVTDGVALRPELSVVKSSGNFTTTSSISFNGTATTTISTSTNDGWQVGVGLSALCYLSKHDALRTYVTPRWAYTRSSSNTSASGRPSGMVTGTTGTGHFVSGSFGAQYAIARRFSVFGEIGLGYTRTVNSPNASISPVIGGEFTSVIGTQSTSRSLGTRSGAGVVLYF